MLRTMLSSLDALRLLGMTNLLAFLLSSTYLHNERLPLHFSPIVV